MFGYQVYGVSTAVVPLNLLLVVSGALAIVAYFIPNKEFNSKVIR